MESLGKRISNIRKELNLNQKELAEKCGITEATLSRYENDLREPKSEAIVKIANALNVTTDYLLGRTNNKKLNVKDERSIQKDLKDIINDFKSGQSGPAFFNGQELSEKDLEVLEVGMEAILTTLKIQNKEKYTPKKYKKQD